MNDLDPAITSIFIPLKRAYQQMHGDEWRKRNTRSIVRRQFFWKHITQSG